MPKFLNTTGYSDIAIGICDRCRMKRPHAVLSPDPNFPGLMVCDQGCKDQFDPYRLPARKTENITIRKPRPDVPLIVNDNNLTAGGYGNAVISTEGNTDTPETNGNVDGVSI
jgi:hypothetical protein